MPADLALTGISSCTFAGCMACCDVTSVGMSRTPKNSSVIASSV
jgi:hypothetical protein